MVSVLAVAHAETYVRSLVQSEVKVDSRLIVVNRSVWYGGQLKKN